MTKDDIVRKVKALGLPKGSFIIFGSGPLAAKGLRPANDIDLLITHQLWEQLQQKGWQRTKGAVHEGLLVHDVFEAHYHWDFGPYSPSLNYLLATAMHIDGVPFVSVEEVKKWKTVFARPKDLQDLRLIEDYLTVQSS